MTDSYPIYKYTEQDVRNQLARFVLLDSPDSYPFDNFHAHEYNEILIFLTGGGRHNINFHEYSICDNSIHLVAAKDLHWIQRSTDSKGFAVVYKDQFLHKLQMIMPDVDFHDRFTQSEVINLKTEEAKGFRFLFTEIQENSKSSPYLLQLIGSLITKIISLDLPAPATGKTYDSIIIKVSELVEQHYKDRLGIKQYAELLHITPRTLQNRLKKAVGISLNELLQQRLLKEAKRLLCASEMSIGETGFDLGFKETAHFTNWFKKNAGCLPSEYKCSI